MSESYAMRFAGMLVPGGGVGAMLVAKGVTDVVRWREAAT